MTNVTDKTKSFLALSYLATGSRVILFSELLIWRRTYRRVGMDRIYPQIILLMKMGQDRRQTLIRFLLSIDVPLNVAQMSNGVNRFKRTQGKPFIELKTHKNNNNSPTQMVD